LIAQGEVALANDAEELLFQDETTGIPFNQLEEFTDYRQQPINLNRATRKQLAESGLFTPFQIEVLLAYRSKFGALLSVYELASLSGFRRSRVLDIAPYLTVGAGPVPSISNPQDLMFLFTVQRTFPEADGFIPLDTLRKAPAYSGTALKTWLRLKASLSSSFSAGLGYEKDPGEDFFHRGIPEFLSGYFMYRGTRHKQKLVLGNFRIHHGLGLVNGSQFISSVESHYHAFPPNSRIIPYAGLGEARFERGVGCQYAVGRLELMMWASHRPMDLSLHQIEEIPPRMDWEEAVRETGLHRTTSERSGRSLAFRFHQGVVASYRFPRLTLGAMCGWRINGLTTAGRDSLRSEEETFRCITGSINGSWYFGRFGLSWELAVTGDRSTALLAAFNYRLNDFMHGVVLIHRYGPDYRGMNPASYAAGSQLRNDRGVAFGWHIEAGRYFIADLKLELFRHEAPRYLADVPARSCRAVCTIKNSGLSDLHWRFRVYSKSWQRTIGSESPGIDPLINLKVIRSEIQFEYIPGRILPRQDGQLQRKSNNSATGNITKRHLAPPQWQSRLILSWHQESPLQCPDYALVQRLSLSAIDKLRGVLQVAIFHVTAWENRIYLHEPGLLYSFNFPVCDGMGEKVTGTLSTSIGNRITLSCKLGTTFYHDRDATGSGSERREGNKKWEAGLQIRMKL
jgi:hypothetical protein